MIIVWSHLESSESLLDWWWCGRPNLDYIGLAQIFEFWPGPDPDLDVAGGYHRQLDISKAKDIWIVCVVQLYQKSKSGFGKSWNIVEKNEELFSRQVQGYQFLWVWDILRTLNKIHVKCNSHSTPKSSIVPLMDFSDSPMSQHFYPAKFFFSLWEGLQKLDLTLMSRRGSVVPSAMLRVTPCHLGCVWLKLGSSTGVWAPLGAGDARTLPREGAPAHNPQSPATESLLCTNCRKYKLSFAAW